MDWDWTVCGCGPARPGRLVIVLEFGSDQVWLGFSGRVAYRRGRDSLECRLRFAGSASCSWADTGAKQGDGMDPNSRVKSC